MVSVHDDSPPLEGHRWPSKAGGIDAVALSYALDGWMEDKACLGGAKEHVHGHRSCVRLHLCFALCGAGSACAALARLKGAIVWQSRRLEWHGCKELCGGSSRSNKVQRQGPDGPDASGMECLVTVSLLAAPGEAEKAEASLLKGIQLTLRGAGAECFLTCPGHIPLFAGGLSALTTASPPALAPTRPSHVDGALAHPSPAVLRVMELLRGHGVAVLPGAVGEAALGTFRRCVQERIELLASALGRRGVSLTDNAIFTFEEIAARGRHRFDARLDLDAPEAAGVSAALAAAPWLEVVRAMLGDDTQVIASVVFSSPGADAQEWHADGPHLGGNPDSPPYALCVFVPLTDLTPATGFTQFWPGTHNAPHLLGFGPAAEVLEATADAVCAAGAALMYDYRVLHRGMPNVSAAARRDLLQVVYHRRGYKEARNYRGPSLLTGRLPSR